jgi:hypothetical protein
MVGWFRHRYILYIVTSELQTAIVSKKNPIILIFYISGWLAISVNPGKWSTTVMKMDPADLSETPANIYQTSCSITQDITTQMFIQ